MKETEHKAAPKRVRNGEIRVEQNVFVRPLEPGRRPRYRHLRGGIYSAVN